MPVAWKRSTTVIPAEREQDSCRVRRLARRRRRPRDTWETNRELAVRSYGDPGKATDADLLAVWNAAGFDDPRVFETVIAVSRWEAGRVADVRLNPVDLGDGERITRNGTPRLAAPPVALRILERLQRISKFYGTSIEIEGDVGVIRLARLHPPGLPVREAAAEGRER